MFDNTHLAQFLPYLLSITSNAVSGRIAVEYRSRFGLSVPEWRAMAVIGDYGPLTQRELTRRTLMDKVAVNRACKALEDRSLASRMPNEQDGRSHLLKLTEAGVAMHDEIMPLALAMEERMFACFDQAELEQFREMLGRVRAELDDFDGEQVDSRNYGVK
ncbi:MarR family transcriptional regulator [Altererythrobacter sp. B11]|uniref:MarR family winged helix-turn-helix transcriptional regulator n=1 Tax=Altererythrobacter sp. B11 TaxID=2060312 RepID=UPI000DC701D9|nr:MarR family transcriptional regulator [Altererythrobacter sp. B11]BBC74175.1 MarR family transcriptional regulator [Altererythrobacter sp. B11]